MSQDHQQPVDMNQMFRGVAQEVVNGNIAAIMANTLISAGNSLRAQGYSMMTNIDAAQLLTKPALLANGSSMALLPFFRPIAGFFRLIVAHTADGGRTFAALAEDETNTLKSGFIELTEEQLAELNRQIDTIGMERKGYVELGLMVVEKPVEGYEYFTVPAAEAPAEAAANDGAAAASATGEAAAPAAAPAAPVELGSVIGDTAALVAEPAAAN